MMNSEDFNNKRGASNSQDTKQTQEIDKKLD